MSVAVLHSRALAGLDSPEVLVEVHLASGLPVFSIVGLADTEVREARDRVRAALVNSQFDFPARRITVNLAPADLRKESGRFDLAIALGILAASGQVDAAKLVGHEFAGELSLTGELRPVRGALPMALGAARAGRTFVLPAASAPEAALASDARVLAASSLLEVCAWLCGQKELAVAEPAPMAMASEVVADLAEVRGQPAVKRALEVAAAGGHSVLLIGPPGTGKSMMAARFPGLLPPMTQSEAIDAAAVQSLGSGGFRTRDWGRRPFRSPHHSASSAAIVGGGSDPQPGEISLAHNGVLFFDELPEFRRDVLEVLREPLETGRVSISRAARQAEFPARFQLVAAMNPCPCGYLGHYNGRCRCTPDRIARYRGRLSGPLLDRIDIRMEVPAVPPEDLLRDREGDASDTVRRRVALAREVMLARQGCDNASLQPAQLDAHCVADKPATVLLRQSISRLGLSARAAHRILRVARTIADLDGATVITAAHAAEAVQYRRFDPAPG